MVMVGVLPDICFTSVSPLRFGYGFSLVCASSMLSGDRASLVFGTRRDVRGLHLGTAKIFISKSEGPQTGLQTVPVSL